MSDTIEAYIKSLRRKTDNTKAGRRNALYRLENWADREIDELTEGDIEDFIAYLKDEGIQNSTINNYLSHIRQYFRYLRKNLEPGVNEDELRAALLAQKRYNNIIDVANLPERERVKEAISHRGLKDLLLNAKSRNKKHYRVFVLLAYFGFRKSELLTLRCEDVDRDKREIHIRDSKTAAGHRTVPYAPKLDDLLACDGDLLLTGYGDSEYSDASINWMLKEYENDVTGHLYPHRFRITLDTYLIEAGVEKYIINQLMGWKGQGDMADYYRGKTKRLEKEKREAMEEKHYLLPILEEIERAETEKEAENKKSVDVGGRV